jgi:hypothetical protein
MDYEEARMLRDELMKDVREAQKLTRESVDRAQGGIQMIEGLLRMFPGLNHEPFRDDSPEQLLDPGDDPPRGQHAVKRIMVETPGRWWTVTGFVKEMQLRGWISEDEKPSNAVRMAAERVVGSDPSKYHKDKGKKTGTTTYSYRPFADEPSLAVDMVTVPAEPRSPGG